jgi:bifunctional non-homologous end joining protein LigD
MRDFKATPEPAGRTHAKEGNRQQLPFVIQKHAATRLHYDFRLGWNGVLKSWAVTKGPSYFPGDKRLAVQVEDHPIDYGGFEGIIPKGQYGGGTVMVWDEGTWTPQPGHEDVDAGLRKGALKFTLQGKKLLGNWTLVRMGGRAAEKGKQNWLLIKEHDAFERGSEDEPIVDEAPNSAITGRTMGQIAAGATHVWNGKGAAGNQPDKISSAAKSGGVSSSESSRRVRNGASSKDEVSRRAAIGKIRLAGARKESLPGFIAPQLAQQAVVPPTGEAWVHEIKLDGYRIEARIQNGKVKLFTRTGLDWTHRLKPIAEALAECPAKAALLDGEVCVVSPDGTTSFANLQASFENGEKHPLTYFAFDLLHLNGHNLRPLPLSERKAALAQLIANWGAEQVVFSEHLIADGALLFRRACELHAEGIVSKRADRPYHSGRTGDWLKIKCAREQEFVIGGFTLPSNGIHGIGALLLGYYDDSGHLIYAGRTGTGFNAKTHSLLRDKLDRLRRDRSPFSTPPAVAQRNAIWVRPVTVAQVAFATWTADNLVRQAAFRGLREDKPASEVRREDASAPAILPGEKSKIAVTKSPAIRKKQSPAQPASRRSAPLPQAPVRLTHPNKILDPDSQLTKRHLADYYWAVASHMLTHIANRPISLVRCPEGSDKPCFFQKHGNHMLPPGVDLVDVPDKKTGRPEQYITLSSPEALAGLAQIGVLEVHPWASTNDHLDKPDRIIIDLDPDTAISWRKLAEAANDVRTRLKKAGLESFVKTTGGKGLHVVAPIEPQHNFAKIKDWAHAFVLQMERDNPALYLTRMTKAARENRIFLDYLRNERGATAVAPYSPRARTGAPASVPLLWSELDQPEHPVFRVADFLQWRARLTRDPWKKMSKLEQKISLTAASS